MHLTEIVEKYRQLAGGFGKSVPLANFGLSREETEKLFSDLDEDYHISRFFHFSMAAGASAYTISGFAQSHLTIDAEIEQAL
jgi:hypothetical protein